MVVFKLFDQTKYKSLLLFTHQHRLLLSEVGLGFSS